MVASLLPRMPGFAPGSVHVGFVVDKVALGQEVAEIKNSWSVTSTPPHFLFICS
jgi:hypothetical protein